MKQPLKADSPTKLRVACLDGLRPLLIFWVISFHWEPTGTTAKPWPTFLAPLTWTVDRVQRRAWIACDCFFVLSGFVAAMGKCGRSVAAGRERLTFLWRGIARLAPCYYVSLAWWVLALFLHDVKVKNYGRYQSDASKYDSVDLRTLHGSGFPLTLLMLQSWWPVFERDSSAHPYHSHKWQPDPHGVVFVPYAVDYTLWFASALVGCYAVYAFLAARCPRTPGKLAASIAVCCLLRASPAIVAAVVRLPCAGEAGDNAMTLTFENIPRHAVDEDGVWECTRRWVPGSAYVFPLVNACSFVAGALTFRLCEAVDLSFLPTTLLSYACAVAVPAVVYVSPDGSPMERTRSTPLTFVFCALCALAVADDGRAGLFRALEHPALQALAPAAYAAYAFQAPLMKTLELLGFDGAGSADAPAFFLFLLLLWGLALAFTARVDAKAQAWLVGLGPAAAAPRYGTFAAPAADVEDAAVPPREEPLLARFVGDAVDLKKARRPDPPGAAPRPEHDGSLSDSSSSSSLVPLTLG